MKPRVFISHSTKNEFAGQVLAAVKAALGGASLRSRYTHIIQLTPPGQDRTMDFESTRQYLERSLAGESFTIYRGSVEDFLAELMAHLRSNQEDG